MPDTSAVLIPALVEEHHLTEYACPDCLCESEMIQVDLELATDNYVLVGVLDRDAEAVALSGYLEAIPMAPIEPAMIGGEV